MVLGLVDRGGSVDTGVDGTVDIAVFADVITFFITAPGVIAVVVFNINNVGVVDAILLLIGVCVVLNVLLQEQICAVSVRTWLFVKYFSSKDANGSTQTFSSDLNISESFGPTTFQNSPVKSFTSAFHACPFLCK